MMMRHALNTTTTENVREKSGIVSGRSNGKGGVRNTKSASGGDAKKSAQQRQLQLPL
jgi:hypothetical protein